MYRVHYERYNMDRSNRPGFWESLTKDFNDIIKAKVFIRNIEELVIVKNIYMTKRKCVLYSKWRERKIAVPTYLNERERQGQWVDMIDENCDLIENEIDIKIESLKCELDDLGDFMRRKLKGTREQMKWFELIMYLFFHMEIIPLCFKSYSYWRNQ